MIYRHLVLSDLSKISPTLRNAFEINQMSRKRSPIPLSRFIWDYWHVPNEYTYFRTFPHMLFSNEDYHLLCKSLTELSERILGSNRINTIWSSYYLESCRQELHQDISQGGWAFVLNLSSNDLKKYSGGRTYLLKENEKLEKNENFYNAGEKFDVIELKFGELLIFDGQIPHGVDVVSGTNDPMEGRLVVHGWFAEPQFKTNASEEGKVKDVVLNELSKSDITHLVDSIEIKTRHHLTFRIEAEADGTITNIQLLTAKGSLYSSLEPILIGALRKTILPKNADKFFIILPLTFDPHSNS